jgi:hypothetical protein
MKKIIFGILFLTIVGIQLIPRHHDNSAVAENASIDQIHYVPDEVLKSFKKSCYDCHSNQSTYPWYSFVQPVSIWINHHIDEGKEELNFSEFGKYSLRRQFHKLEEISEQIEADEMPLASYTLIHRNTTLSSPQKTAIKEWVRALRDSFQNNYPVDSLKRKKRTTR